MFFFLFFIHLFIHQAYALDTSSTSAAPIVVAPTLTPTIDLPSPTLETSITPTDILTPTPTNSVATGSAMTIATPSATPTLPITPTPKKVVPLIITLTPTPIESPLGRVSKTITHFKLFQFPESFFMHPTANYYKSSQLSPTETLVLLSIAFILFIAGLILLFWDSFFSKVIVKLGLAKKNEIVYATIEA